MFKFFHSDLDSSVDVPRRTLPEVGATFDATLAITIKQTNAIKNIFIYPRNSPSFHLPEYFFPVASV